MKMLRKILPWFFVVLFGSEIAAIFAPKKDGEFHVRAFGALPVLMNGRIQPFDSVGLNSLRQIRSTSDVPLEEVPSWQFWHHPKKLKPTEWLLELMFHPEEAAKRPIFLIHHPELLSELKLENSGVDKSGLRYYTYEQLQPLIGEIMKQGMLARQVTNETERTPVQKQVVKLQNALFLYQSLQLAICPPGWEDFGAELKAFETALPAGMEALQAKEAGKPFDQAAYEKLWEPVTEFFTLAKDTGAGQYYPLVLPPVDPETKRDNWSNIGKGLLDSVRDREIYAPIKSYAALVSAYRNKKPAEFNKAVDDYKSWLGQKFQPELKKGREEFFYNDTKVFLHAMIIYLCAFILGIGSLLALSLAPNLAESLRKSSYYLIILAGCAHTFGLLFRMHLEGRPPVTNLYSSAIFIGWGAMILGLVLERVYRLGIGNLVSSVAGFVTLIIAHNLSLGGDTMEMLRAVLDTNVWLATHVVIVTLGYASTFVAGLLAVIYIFIGVFTPLLTKKISQDNTGKVSPEIGKALAKMVYGIVCFATLFSFVGTVLGGIWADQSWGRFWGWDPKENGALIIVIWNAIILHARGGGMIRERGLMAMAVFGNIVTSFSWFGVNMLGIGLHSYGFMDQAFWWLLAFDFGMVFLILLALLPLRYWTSFKTSTPEKNAPAPVLTL